MLQFAKRSRGFARALALIGFTGLLLLALMTTLDVLLRWLFQAPLQGVNDISSVVMAVVIAVCIPANLAMKQNIKVEVFGTVGGKTLHDFLEVLASTLTLVFITIIAWQFVPYASGLRETGDRTWVLGWPVWPWWSVAAMMMWFAALIQLTVLLDDLRTLFAGGDDNTPSPETTSTSL
tara:strand:- start:458 stop:991 length:534 start_codon:yes stop_codon:yes gene_type:complete